jgi:hypothetical protein
MAASRRRFIAFLLAVMAGMAGESLLLIHTQVARFERLLREDFKVLMFLRADPSEGEEKVLEEKLLGMPDVREVRFVSRDAALSTLRREDPELVDSVAWIGENPLRSAFEVSLTPGGLGRFAAWLAAARDVTDWADVRYRPGQVRAILQAQLYGHFLGLILNALLCAAAVVLAAVLWWMSPALPSVRAVASVAELAAGATAIGMILALAAAWPARGYLPWWESPAWGPQLLIWAAVSLMTGLSLPWTALEFLA